MWQPTLSSSRQTGYKMLKTFRDRQSYDKKFYHVNMFGFKFRVATNTRGKGGTKYNTYQTGRGQVLNLGRQYMCFIPKA